MFRTRHAWLPALALLLLRIASEPTGLCQPECLASPANPTKAGKLSVQCQPSTDRLFPTQNRHSTTPWA